LESGSRSMIGCAVRLHHGGDRFARRASPSDDRFTKYCGQKY
jgi:hypothetical protein